MSLTASAGTRSMSLLSSSPRNGSSPTAYLAVKPLFFLSSSTRPALLEDDMCWPWMKKRKLPSGQRIDPGLMVWIDSSRRALTYSTGNRHLLVNSRFLCWRFTFPFFLSSHFFLVVSRLIKRRLERWWHEEKGKVIKKVRSWCRLNQPHSRRHQFRISSFLWEQEFIHLMIVGRLSF